MFGAGSRVGRWFTGRFEKPTPAQAAAIPVLAAGEHALIVSPTGTGKTLAAFLHILNSLVEQHETGVLDAALQGLYISPLRALTYDLKKNLVGPLQEMFPGDPPIQIAVRTGDTPSAERQRQRERPPHLLLTTPETLCLLLCQPRWVDRLKSVRWVVLDELHSLVGNKRGAHLSLSLERLTEVVGGCGPQRIGLSATVAPLDEAALFLGGLEWRPTSPEQNSGKANRSGIEPVPSEELCPRQVRILEVHAPKRMDLRVHTPLQSDPYPKAGFTGARLTRDLCALVRKHRTTLIFTNTRSGAEATTYLLRRSLPELREQIECHHGSLDRDIRFQVEDALKRGALRAVVCSSSLELGIDIGCIDLVVMLATPKGVSRAVQRTGRAGHRLDAISRGLLMATNIGDLVECCATACLARAGHLDPVRVSEAPLDVLAQHLVGLGCLQEWSVDAAFRLVRRARPYRDLDRAAFQDVLDYLAGGGESLRQQYTDVFGKIHLDPHTFETRAGSVRRDYLENIGTIPSEGLIRVLLGRAQLGAVEEGFIRRLALGDVFLIAGRPLRLDRLGNMECWVSPAPGRLPTIPRWGANKFPLSNRVAGAIRNFRAGLRQQLESERSFTRLMDWVRSELQCEPKNAAAILRLHIAQRGVSEIPTADFLLIEEWMEPIGVAEEEMGAGNRPSSNGNRRVPRVSRGRRGELDREIDSRGGQLAMNAILFPAAPSPKRRSSARLEQTERSSSPSTETTAVGARHYFLHTLIGRAANDALSRVVGYRMGRLLGQNPVATADDYGFVLTLNAGRPVAESEWSQLFSTEKFEDDLDAVLGRSDLVKYHFRTAAQTGLMVYRNYFGEKKSVRKLQWSAEVLFNVLVDHEPHHVLLREARRDACETFLDVPAARLFLEEMSGNRIPIRIRQVPVVPPLSFGMYATRIREALMVEDPREVLERLYHEWWTILESYQ